MIYPDIKIRPFARNGILPLLLLLFFFCSAGDIQAAENSDSVALIIGNKNYVDAAVPAVSYAVNDAKAIRNYVIERLGYQERNVHIVEDATFAQLNEWFGGQKSFNGKLNRLIRPNKSNVFVFYSGHGVPSLNTKEKYLLPVDGKLSAVDNTGYPLDLLYKNLGQLRAKSVQVYLDACFSGRSGANNAKSLYGKASGISVMPKSSIVNPKILSVTASRDSEVASWDDASRHGLFTRHLLEALYGAADEKKYGNGDGKITIAELDHFLREEMTFSASREFGRDQHATFSHDQTEQVVVELNPVGQYVDVQNMNANMLASKGAVIRSGPSTKDKIIKALEVESVLKVTGTKNYWHRVALADGRVGFALGRYLDEMSGDKRSYRYRSDGQMDMDAKAIGDVTLGRWLIGANDQIARKKFVNVIAEALEIQGKFGEFSELSSIVERASERYVRSLSGPERIDQIGIYLSQFGEFPYSFSLLRDTINNEISIRVGSDAVLFASVHMKRFGKFVDVSPAFKSAVLRDIDGLDGDRRLKAITRYIRAHPDIPELKEELKRSIRRELEKQEGEPAVTAVVQKISDFGMYVSLDDVMLEVITRNISELSDKNKVEKLGKYIERFPQVLTLKPLLLERIRNHLDKLDVGEVVSVAMLYQKRFPEIARNNSIVKAAITRHIGLTVGKAKVQLISSYMTQFSDMTELRQNLVDAIVSDVKANKGLKGVELAAAYTRQYKSKVDIQGLLGSTISVDLTGRVGADKLNRSLFYIRKFKERSGVLEQTKETLAGYAGSTKPIDKKTAKVLLGRLATIEKLVEKPESVFRLQGLASHILKNYGDARKAYTKWLASTGRGHPDRQSLIDLRIRAEKHRPLPPIVFKDCDLCPVMVVVPGGEFNMGAKWSEKGSRPEERPQRKVVLKEAFSVGKFEVTFEQWNACVAGGGCNAYEPVHQNVGGAQHPVVNVSWNDANSFAAWLSRRTSKHYRLLTEAEWEYMARAGTTTTYYFGKSIQPSQANYASSTSSEGKTEPVGHYLPNAFGIFDAHGNVWEWVEDCWVKNYHGAFGDGTRARVIDKCQRRVRRGGAWADHPSFLRSSARDGSVSTYRSSVNGFRIATSEIPN